MRLLDIANLLVLQIPVRCHTCMKRDWVSFSHARRMRAAEMATLAPHAQQQQSHG